jgi:hypothetical protein
MPKNQKEDWSMRIRAFEMTLIVPFLILLFASASALETFSWLDVSHGATVRITLITENLWVTNNTYTILFSFTVQKLSGYLNNTYYSNSRVILKSVSLDPSYIGKSESPLQSLTEGQTTTISWSFTPKANDLTLSALGIAKGKRVQYSLPLEIEYTVVDSEGNEWPSLFQTLTPNSPATIDILGGDDAQPTVGTLDNYALLIVFFVIVGVAGLVGAFRLIRVRRRKKLNP